LRIGIQQFSLKTFTPIDDFFNLECITKVQDIQTALQQLLLFLFNKKITQKKAFLYKVL